MEHTQAQLPIPHSAEELALLVGLGHSISHFHRMSAAEQDVILKQLEMYECHAQVVKLLDWRIDHTPQGNPQLFADFLKLLRIQYLGLERFDDFVESACRGIARLKLPFSMVRIHMAEDILGAENYHEQAPFYKKVMQSFGDPVQKVLLLERLSLIYEKKLFLENEVEPIFRQLLELDKYNTKARRFFKLWYMQAMSWKDVAENLEFLIEASHNPHERRRAAHELAQLYLYNLNQPKEAREILLQYCSEMMREVRQTYLECLERLELYDELLALLKDAERNAEDEIEIANIKLKAGLVCIKASRALAAIPLLRESIIHNSHLLHSYEALISALLEAGRSEEISQVVTNLSKVVNLESSRKALNDFQLRANKVRNLPQ